ncbi:ANL_collapsed_G0045190.mRNA.1.CDS.1 [Saccharomyces cerevisiae]|nr:ANL_collapsed_G0045190.mRNA.1.CDS.1 [Saccharomyces cerevisiae]
MSIENLKSFDPFADTGDDETATSNYIHIRIQQRNGRKTLTTVQGVPEEYDLKRILKVLKRTLHVMVTLSRIQKWGRLFSCRVTKEQRFANL